ncbi:MAG TPA: carboxypeptidase-like regulatory domain-containing protein [Williamwhitmania sp.]|nr:carboxypeptidase-like regulatory domain-containing protein [Williamwhitmania sp.]
MKSTFYKLGTKTLLAAAFLILSGCATIVSKSIYPISVTSNPPGAKVTVMNRNGINIYSTITPATFTLAASAGYFTKASYTVTFEMPGYESVTVPVFFSLDGWYVFGNIAVGGLMGWLIIDPITGAMWKLNTKSINETLVKSATSLNTPTLKIMSYNDIPESWKANLVRIN